ncbi:MAG: hypothetical protein KatS3mg109_0272 [Pirellulaceae bacterium]|nr:MAG: hypothetical protein KatS3mg109_0272 [Pirellulaceae bacterium]
MSLRRTGSHIEDLIELGHNFNSLRDRPVLRRVDPPHGSLTLEDLLNDEELRKPAHELADAFQILKLRHALADCPIIGVVGELNAGKSSVVAAFLSKEGQARIPRGYEDRYGTHRFVYWVPHSWRKIEEIWREFRETLVRAHGSDDFEELPESPDEAAQMYASGENDPELFAKPIIAFDEGLERLGLALLDCPDFQTEESKKWKGKGKTRLDFLKEASRLCSAILFVCEPAHGRDGRIRKAFRDIKMAKMGVPLYLLANRLPARKDVWETLAAVNALREMVDQSDGVYAAYDFNHSGWQDRVPRMIKEQSAAYRTHQEPVDGIEPLPVFFRVPRDVILAGSAKDDIRDRLERYAKPLEELPKSLGCGTIQRQALQKAAEAVPRRLREFEQRIQEWMAERRKQAADLRKHLLALLAEQFSDKEGNPRGPISKELIVEIDKAMWRTAPWWARPALWIKRKIDLIIRAVSRLFSILRTPVPDFPSFTRKATLLDVEELASRMKELKWVPIYVEETNLTEAWSRVLESLLRVPSYIRRDTDELDQLATKEWNRLPLKKKLLIAVSSLGISISLGVAAIDAILTVLVHVTGAGIWPKLIVGAAALITTVFGPSAVAALKSLLGAIAAIYVFLKGQALYVMSLTIAVLGPWLVPALKEAKLYWSAAFWATCDVFGVARFEDEPPTVKLDKEEFTLEAPPYIGLAEPLPVTCPLDQLAGAYKLTDDMQSFLARAQEVVRRIR